MAPPHPNTVAELEALVVAFETEKKAVEADLAERAAIIAGREKKIEDMERALVDVKSVWDINSGGAKLARARVFVDVQEKKGMQRRK